MTNELYGLNKEKRNERLKEISKNGEYEKTYTPDFLNQQNKKRGAITLRNTEKSIVYDVNRDFDLTATYLNEKGTIILIDLANGEKYEISNDYKLKTPVGTISNEERIGYIKDTLNTLAEFKYNVDVNNVSYPEFLSFDNNKSLSKGRENYLQALDIFKKLAEQEISEISQPLNDNSIAKTEYIHNEPTCIDRFRSSDGWTYYRIYNDGKITITNRKTNEYTVFNSAGGFSVEKNSMNSNPDKILEKYSEKNILSLDNSFYHEKNVNKVINEALQNDFLSSKTIESLKQIKENYAKKIQEAKELYKESILKEESQVMDIKEEKEQKTKEEVKSTVISVKPAEENTEQMKEVEPIKDEIKEVKLAESIIETSSLEKPKEEEKVKLIYSSDGKTAKFVDGKVKFEGDAEDIKEQKKLNDAFKKGDAFYMKDQPKQASNDEQTRESETKQDENMQVRGSEREQQINVEAKSQTATSENIETKEQSNSVLSSLSALNPQVPSYKVEKSLENDNGETKEQKPVKEVLPPSLPKIEIEKIKKQPVEIKPAPATTRPTTTRIYKLDANGEQIKGSAIDRVSEDSQIFKNAEKKGDSTIDKLKKIYNDERSHKEIQAQALEDFKDKQKKKANSKANNTR